MLLSPSATPVLTSSPNDNAAILGRRLRFSILVTDWGEHFFWNNSKHLVVHVHWYLIYALKSNRSLISVWCDQCDHVSVVACVLCQIIAWAWVAFVYLHENRWYLIWSRGCQDKITLSKYLEKNLKQQYEHVPDLYLVACGFSSFDQLLEVLKLF